MKITLEDRTLAEVPVVAIEQVEIGSIFVRTWDSLRLLFK
jgi:D-alanyl-D-alanine carboxypeptidase (penicillin-binding protein 5/6)